MAFPDRFCIIPPSMAFKLDSKSGFRKEGGTTSKRYIFWGPEERAPVTYVFKAYFRSSWVRSGKVLTPDEFADLKTYQAHTPLHVMTIGQRKWWWYRGSFYHTTEELLDPLVAKGLLIQQEERARKREERARAAARGESVPRNRRGRNKSNDTGTKDDLSCPYAALGVEKSATLPQIKAAYRKRMTEYHPDKVSHLGMALRELAEEMSKRINTAYEELLARHKSSG